MTLTCDFSSIEILPICGPPEVKQARLKYRLKKQNEAGHIYADREWYLTSYQGNQGEVQSEVPQQRMRGRGMGMGMGRGRGTGVGSGQYALTENGALAYSTSGSSCLDFFYKVLPGCTSEHEIFELLFAAWLEDPDLCLKLIFQLGSTRIGKQDRFNFYHALYWLSKNHPATLLHNLHVVPKVVYFKALIELLCYMCEGETNLYQKRQNAIESKIRCGGAFVVRKRMGQGKNKPKIRVSVRTKKLQFEKQQREPQFLRALKKYDTDPVFRTAHNLICQLFVEYLKKDLENLQNGKISCSLAAKWIPNVNSGYDNRTLLCEGIARRLFPKNLPEYENLSEEYYSYRIRDRLRKEVYVPLRKHIKVPEIFMGSNQWDKIRYECVPSVCMRLRKHQFQTHDEQRFKSYIDQVQNGKKKQLSSGAVQPHEILRDAVRAVLAENGDMEQVAQLQWESLVTKIKSFGQLTNCVVVCDVSGSMCCQAKTGVLCIEVAIALTLLVSEVTSEPWNNHAITFSASPQFQQIQGTNLRERSKSLLGIEFGYNTDFQKVFDAILLRAQQAQLPPSEMVRTVFIFSDMQFDAASGQFGFYLQGGLYVVNPAWETSHEIVKQKFEAAGYPLPNLVYWNLQTTDNVPIQKHETCACLLSGYSANLLKLFMEGGLEEYNPMEILLEAVQNPLFQQLKVVD